MSHLSGQSASKVTPASNTGVDMEATTILLRSLMTQCTACRQSLDGHAYRFFSCHPDSDTPETRVFKAAADAGDWATVHAMQTPSVDQARFVVYAIACPGKNGGMVAMLHLNACPGTGSVLLQLFLSPGDFAALRALCPACQWIPFTPALQSGQETV